MKTYEYDSEVAGLRRAHPWTTTADPDHRHYDFRESPELIRSSLEDLVPWKRYPAIERMYAMIEWINGASSSLESNDCALTGPEPSTHPDTRLPIECSGRVMVLFRDLARNVGGDAVDELSRTLLETLTRADQSFERGAIGTTVIPVDYVTLPEGERDGSQLMISFWAWGRNDAECMASLDRVLRNLDKALRELATAS